MILENFHANHTDVNYDIYFYLPRNCSQIQKMLLTNKYVQKTLSLLLL